MTLLRSDCVRIIFFQERQLELPLFLLLFLLCGIVKMEGGIMELRSYVFCEGAYPDREGNNILVNPLQFIVVKYLPTQYSFYFSFGVANVSENGLKGSVDFYGPNKELIRSADVDTGNAPHDIEEPDHPLGLQLSIGFTNVEIVEQGIYVMKINIDGLMDEIEIEVRKE